MVDEELTEIMEVQVELMRVLHVIVVSKLDTMRLHALIIHNTNEVHTSYR